MPASPAATDVFLCDAKGASAAPFCFRAESGADRTAGVVALPPLAGIDSRQPTPRRRAAPARPAPAPLLPVARSGPRSPGARSPPSDPGAAMPRYPRYADLPRPDGTGLPLAWGVWGKDDQIGTLNHITAQTVRGAAALIQRGERFNLDLPLHVPYGLCSPGGHRRRTQPAHTILDIPPTAIAGLQGRDDKLDSFWPQGSSQWDGLTHIGDPLHGFYNGVQPAQITGQDGTRNGMENMAAFGIAGRAVLADLPRHFAAIGRAWEPNSGHVVRAEELSACLAAGHVTVQPGDIVLVRTGWLADYLAASRERRDAILSQRTFSGLSGAEDMWGWLWEQRVAAVAADQPTAEVWPLHVGQPSLHRAIARLGLTLGELFDLEALAVDCARDGRSASFFTSKPLNLRGGVGSPPNAIAIK